MISSGGATKTGGRLVGFSFVGIAVFALMLFVPAGTVNYRHGWVFLAVFAFSTRIPSIYLMQINPAALKRRMQAGPAAETRLVQKIVSTIAFSLVIAMIVLSVLDHRFGWSPAVPAAVCAVGEALVTIGLGGSMLVVIQNSYAAANRAARVAGPTRRSATTTAGTCKTDAQHLVDAVKLRRAAWPAAAHL